jgi:hypothetical protein
MSDPAPAVPATRLPSFVSLTLAAFVVRAAFLLLEPSTHPVADERTWTNWAVENLISAKVSLSPLRTHMIFYPPLYPYFVALGYLAFGSLAGVKWAQVVVASLLVPAVGRVGARVFGRRVGVLAAGIAAFYPELCWFSVHFWSETLFMVLLWWALERLVAAGAAASVGSAVAAGVLWGLAILTRETALYFTPLAALWLAWGRRSGGRARGGAFLLAAVLTVAPWTLRNWVVFRAFVPVSTAGGLNLFQGNARLTRQEVYDLYEAVGGRIEQYRYAQRMGLRAILDRQPGWLFEKLVEQMPNFWEADSLALIHIKRGAYGPTPPAIAVTAAAVVLAPYLAVLAFMVLGIAALTLDRPRVLLVGFLAYYNLIHVATHGFARYRLPIMPVVFLLAASGWVAWRERAPGGGGEPARSRPVRVAAAAAVGLVLVLSLVPGVARNLRHPAFGFADQGGPAGEEAPPP